MLITKSVATIRMPKYMCSLLVCYICVTFLGHVRNSMVLITLFAATRKHQCLKALYMCPVFKRNVCASSIWTHCMCVLKKQCQTKLRNFKMFLDDQTRAWYAGFIELQGALRRSITTCAIDPNGTCKIWRVVKTRRKCQKLNWRASTYTFDTR